MGQQEQTTSVPQFSKKDGQQQQQQQNSFENSKPNEALLTTFHLSNNPPNPQKKNTPNPQAKWGAVLPLPEIEALHLPALRYQPAFRGIRSIPPKNLGRKPLRDVVSKRFAEDFLFTA